MTTFTTQDRQDAERDSLPNFIEICIEDKYVIRIYKCGIYKSELGNLSVKMLIEEWNEHVKNVKETFK